MERGRRREGGKGKGKEKRKRKEGMYLRINMYSKGKKMISLSFV